MRGGMSFSRVLEWVFRLVLGAAFLKAGYEKARDPIQFLFDIRSFHLLPDPYAAMVSMSLPWLEILCALGIVIKKLYTGSLAVLASSGRSPLAAGGGPMIAVRVAAPEADIPAGPSLWQQDAPP